MTQTFNKKRGFTLIELLVVIVITTTISGITLANYRASEKQKRVSLAADGIVNTLTLAQNYSLTGKLTTNSNVGCRTPQYYYVSFTTFNYSLYALNNCGTPDLIESFAFPATTGISSSGMVIDSIQSVAQMKIAFYPPFGKIQGARDANAFANFTTATITVELLGGTITKTLTVDGVAGRIGL